MIEFSATSADGLALSGRHWPVDTPKAAMALVHGFGEHCGRYAHMASHLNSHGIAVVSLDLHGHGQTPGKRGVIFGYSDFRADLAALLKAARGFHPNVPLILYGHSMGGGIVLDHGLRGEGSLPIIASAPFIRLADPIPKPLSLFVKLMGRIHPKGAISQPIDATKISNLPEEQAAYADSPLCHGTMGFRLAEAMVETGKDIAAKAKNWDRPLLLLHSTGDQLTSHQASADFAKSAKQCQFHSFETVQHEMHNDTSRDEIYKLMTDFILSQATTKSV